MVCLTVVKSTHEPPQEHIQTAPGNQGIFNRASSVEAHTLVIKGKRLVGVKNLCVCGPLVQRAPTTGLQTPASPWATGYRAAQKKYLTTLVAMWL